MEHAADQTWIATIVLLAWPVVVLWLYHSLPATKATVWSILASYMVLPVGASIKLAEGIPQLDKVSIPALSALAGCVIFAKRPMRFWNGFGLPEILLLMFLIGPFITSTMNTDAVTSGSVVLPGLSAYDGLSASVSQFLFILPFFLGRRLLGTAPDVEEILRALVIGGLLYSLLMLFEIRMSPQLHYWLYGYYPFGFATQIRYGGFRPSVFMENGLIAVFFLMTATVAAAAFWRTNTRVQRLPSGGITAYLGAVLVLCKSFGTLIYGVLLVPLVRFSKPTTQLRIAVVLSGIAVCYPLLRTADLVPTSYLVAAARYANEDRADSLDFRFIHEKQLLNRASRRIVFGWGRFGRNRIYDMWGKDVSVTDGRWAITLGQFGVFGFLGEFGLLALTVFRAASALRFAESKRDSIFLGALALIIAINMVDLLPNASLTPWTWLLAGALLGRSEALRGTARQPRQKARLAQVRQDVHHVAVPWPRPTFDGER